MEENEVKVGPRYLDFCCLVISLLFILHSSPEGGSRAANTGWQYYNNNKKKTMSLSLPLPSRSSQIRTLAITPASRKHKFLHIPVQQWTPSRPLQHLHTNHQYYLSRTSFQCMSRGQQQEYEVERLFSNLNQVTLKREPGIPVLTLFFFFLIKKIL